jgi:pyridoxine/pyridoxamine 5'-phosphate oxidase
LRKQTEKLKENLATRRKDRIDPKKYAGLSIVDLAIEFDQSQKDTMFTRAQEFTIEEDELRTSPLLIGNKEDQDADVFDRNEA